MAISNLNDLVSAYNSSQIVPFFKAATTAGGIGRYSSYWTVSGEPGAGSTPPIGSGESPTRSTAGAIPIVNASGGNTLYLVRAGYAGITVGHYILYDRLVHTSGLLGNTLDPQTINSSALTRYTTGEGCRLWLEAYATTGIASCTLSYTNSSGISGRTATVTFSSSAADRELVPATLQVGDTGVRSVQSLTMNASGTAGNYGITIVRPIVQLPISLVNSGNTQDAISLGLPKIETDACLALMFVSSTSGAYQPFMGQFNFAEG